MFFFIYQPCACSRRPAQLLGKACSTHLGPHLHTLTSNHPSAHSLGERTLGIEQDDDDDDDDDDVDVDDHYVSYYYDQH